VSAVVNSLAEFNCSLPCTSNITWSYMSSRLDTRITRPLLETPCAKNRRCQIKSSDNRQTGWSLLSIRQVQLTDAGTYLCSPATADQPDYCETSFNFTGTSLRMLYYYLLLDVVLPFSPSFPRRTSVTRMKRYR